MTEVDYDAEVPIYEDFEEDRLRNEGLHEILIRAQEEAQMDRLVVEFVPEAAIRDNDMPESDSEMDERECVRSVDYLPDGCEIEFSVGQVFGNKEIFQQCVIDHALNNCRNIRQYRYDKGRIGYHCIGGTCDWRVYAGQIADCSQLEVRIYNGPHTCVPNGECDLLKVPVIMWKFLDKIREDPDYYKPMKIEQLIWENWKIKVSRGQCQVARKNALRWIEKEYESQFQRLRDYAAEIETSNPGSTTVVETLRSEAGLNLFNRFYVCFDALKKSWKATCRRLIGLDGCHLKGSMKGVLLVAIGKPIHSHTKHKS